MDIGYGSLMMPDVKRHCHCSKPCSIKLLSGLLVLLAPLQPVGLSLLLDSSLSTSTFRKWLAGLIIEQPHFLTHTPLLEIFSQVPISSSHICHSETCFTSLTCFIPPTCFTSLTYFTSPTCFTSLTCFIP